jgi:HD-GYP domain-containing protein (c-di-GMP phosphodiesterase class II)
VRGMTPISLEDSGMFKHRDILDELNKNLSLEQKVGMLLTQIRTRFPTIERIAVALYEQKTDWLKTYLASGEGENPLQHYSAKLSEAPSLQAILKKGRPRVVNDLDVFDQGQHKHTQAIRAQGYGSSYTMPMYVSGTFFGFLFFNSHSKDVFTEEVLHHLDMVGHLVSLVVINEVASIHTLQASLKTAVTMVYHRDVDTGSHLDRMSNFAWLIARELAPKYQFTDEQIEHIFFFAPLHDMGKIGIPDAILKKQDKLTDSEFEDMKQHTTKGLEIIDVMLRNYGLEGLHHVGMLRNIALYHHEAINGRGYPKGLKGDEIPIEARIVSVADIFDALTSKRPYKKAWSNDEAFATLRKMAGTQVDQDCVEALIKCQGEIEQIQAKLKEDPYG